MLAASAVRAQDPPPIRVDTRLVEVDVVVRSKGRPVEDLKAADFSLFDQGKPQRIAAFSVRRSSEEAARQPLEDGEVSNRLNRTGEDAVSPTIILLDTLNSDPEDLFEARRQLLLYLDRMRPADPVAIYSLNKTLRVVQSFTDDAARLRAVVKVWSADASVDVNAPSLIDDLPVTGDALTDAMIQANATELTDAANLNRAQITAFALDLIAKHLAGLPGRKKLVWVGASFTARTTQQLSRVKSTQIEVRDYSQYIDKAARALNEAQVAVYPIDPRNPCKGGCGDGAGLMAHGIETMNLFAKATGGRAFYFLSDIAGAFQEAVEDASVTYVLGFYPDSGKLDGKYHELRVKVARSGIDVRHRKGYVAGDGKPPIAATRQKSLRSAMESPLDATGIALSGRLIESPPASIVSDGAPEGSHDVMLRIDPHDLEMQAERAKNGQPVWSALVTLSTFVPKQPKPNATVVELKLTFTEKRLAEILRDGYFMRLPVKDGVAGQFRVAVQDRTSGRTGSLTLTLQ